MKSIVVLIVVVVVVFSAIAYYETHPEPHGLTSGDVFVSDKTRSEPAVTHPSTEAAPATYASSTPAAQSSVTAPPPADSISRNPPNGMIFAGTGRYQLYRQGDLTWRMNTDNGEACIIFATDNEWRKERVYERGCGNI